MGKAWSSGETCKLAVTARYPGEDAEHAAGTRSLVCAAVTHLATVIVDSM